MKVSELIGQLTILMAKHGDVRVKVNADALEEFDAASRAPWTNWEDRDIRNVKPSPNGREYEVDSIELEIE